MGSWARMGVWLVALLLGSGSALGAPSVTHTEPVAVELEPSLVPARGASMGAASAGSGWLAVYSAASDGPDIGEVTGVLVASDGTPGVPFRIGAAGGLILASAVAFDGDAFVVVWSRVLPDQQVATLELQRVTVDGQLMGELQVLDDTSYGRLELARGDSGTLLVAQPEFSDRELLLSWLITVDGVTSVDVLPKPAKTFRLDGAAFSHGTWLVGFRGDDDVLAARVGPEGTFTDDLPFEIAPFPYADALSLAPATEGFVAAWGGSHQVRVGSIKADATVHVPYNYVLSHDDFFTSVRIAGHEGGFSLLVSQVTPSCTGSCQRRLSLQRVSASLEASGSPLPLAADSIDTPSAFVADSAGLLATWSSEDGQLLSRRVTFAQQTISGPPTLLSSGIAAQTDALVARGPNGWLATWREGNQAFGALLDDAGSPRAKPFRLTPGAADSSSVLSVAGSSDGYAIAVTSDESFELVLVGRDQARSVALSRPAEEVTRASVIAANEGWLLVSEETRPSFRFGLRVQQLGPSGARRWDTPFDDAFKPVGGLGVVSNAEGTVVYYSAGSTDARRLTPSGALVPGPAQELLQQATWNLSVASAAERVWFLWEQGAEKPEIRFQPVPSPVSPQVFSGRRVSALVPMAEAVALAWAEGTSQAELAMTDAEGVLTVVDSWPGEWAPALAGDGDGRLLFAAGRRESRYGQVTSRVYTSLVSLGTEPEPGAGAGGAGAAGETSAAGANTAGAGGRAGSGFGGDMGEGGEQGPGTSTDPNASRRSKGCGCRVAGSARAGADWLPLLGAALLLGARRRYVVRKRRSKAMPAACDFSG